MTYFDHLPDVKFAPDSSEPLAYRHYDPDRMLLGKRMEDQLRFAVCYWHSFCWDGFDVFGAGTFGRPWHEIEDGQQAAEAKAEAAFTFFQKVGLPFYCFHDVDVMAPAETPKLYVENFRRIHDTLQSHMERTGKRLLWGTANLFSHPRYMGGASTNPDPEIAAFAALQVKECIEATHKLGGDGYVLWGGREGYDTVLNTDLKRERAQFGRFLAATVEHKHKIGFTGDIWIEPKPCEPAKHQYDFDVSTVYGFLKQFGLENEVGVNIEANHATLSGHSFEHEVEMAFALGIFGSIDMNRGDPQNGWDTDQFPNDIRELTQVMYAILREGGLKKGGLNFDSKVRRQSIDAEDMLHGHVGAVDLIAKAALNAEKMLANDVLGDFKAERYAGWDSGVGADFLSGKADLAAMADHRLCADDSPAPKSGRQEYLENYVSRMSAL